MAATRSAVLRSSRSVPSQPPPSLETSPETTPPVSPALNASTGAVTSASFAELDRLRSTSTTARLALSELHAQSASFGRLRDQIRLAFKPFRDFLRALVRRGRSSSLPEMRLMYVLLCERRVRFGFNGCFARNAPAPPSPSASAAGDDKSAPLSSTDIAHALLANAITPVASELAFGLTRAATGSRDVAELRQLTEHHIRTVRMQRNRFQPEAAPLLAELDGYVDEHWHDFCVAARAFKQLTDIAAEFQQAIQASRLIAL